MKKALTAALFSGLFIFAVPQAAFADHAADHNGDCGAKTEKSAGHSEEQAAPEGQAPEGQAPAEERSGDHQSHDDGTILF
jgi:hypothetical protein